MNRVNERQTEIEKEDDKNKKLFRWKERRKTLRTILTTNKEVAAAATAAEAPKEK